MELFFFFMNFMKVQMTLFLDDLEVQKCAHAQSKSFPIYIIQDDKKISFNFNFYRNENQFFA